MSYGPPEFLDDWDDDEFDFGDNYNTHYSSTNAFKTATQNYFTEQVKPVKVEGSLNTTTKPKEPVGLGRGRGRGGFSLPKNAKKKDGKSKRRGQGNLLFARTGDKAKKSNVDEKKDCLLAEDFRAAIQKGDVALVENILNQGISADCVLKSGWTGLMHAANCGLPQVVAVLTERGANVNFHADMFSVLMAACSSDCDAEDDVVQCVTHLIEKGAKINSHDRYRMTPLMYACRSGHSKSVEIFLRYNPDVNKQDQRGWTALCWAASRGHGRIVRMLLDENANPKQYTNDGQSAEDLAYDGGFKIIADILHAAANPASSMERNVFNAQDPVSSTEQGECLRYGDLELFLCGLELGHLVPLFQGQQISFDSVLQLTDADLQQIGLSQIGVRKKILAATHDVHTKEWDLSSLPSQPSTSQFTSTDMSLVLAHVEKHLVYIKCSIGYARKSLLGLPDPTVVMQDEEHTRQFLAQTRNVLEAVNGITDEIEDLECSMKKISSTVPSAPADIIRNSWHTNEKRKLFFLPILFVGGCVAFGLTAVWRGRCTKH